LTAERYVYTQVKHTNPNFIIIVMIIHIITIINDRYSTALP